MSERGLYGRQSTAGRLRAVLRTAQSAIADATVQRTVAYLFCSVSGLPSTATRMTLSRWERHVIVRNGGNPTYDSGALQTNWSMLILSAE